MAHHLVPLARVAAAHVALDSCTLPGPLEVLGNQRLRPRHAVVPRERGVMILAENGEDEGCRGRGNEDAPLMVEDAPLEL